MRFLTAFNQCKIFFIFIMEPSGYRSVAGIEKVCKFKFKFKFIYIFPGEPELGGGGWGDY